MAAFNMTLLEELGHQRDTTLGLADPRDSRFAAQVYSADAYTPRAVRSALASLASLNAYPTVSPTSKGGSDALARNPDSSSGSRLLGGATNDRVAMYMTVFYIAALYLI